MSAAAYIDEKNRNFFSYNFFLVDGEACELIRRVDGWYGLYDCGRRMVALIEPDFDYFESPAWVDRRQIAEKIRTLKCLVDMRDAYHRRRLEEAESRDAEYVPPPFYRDVEPVYESGAPTMRLTPQPPTC